MPKLPTASTYSRAPFSLYQLPAQILGVGLTMTTELIAFFDGKGRAEQDLEEELPWVSREVLAGAGFSEKSDVYSYGVVLWEIMQTEPSLPYAGLLPDEVRVRVRLNPPVVPKARGLGSRRVDAWTVVFWRRSCFCGLSPGTRSSRLASEVYSRPGSSVFYSTLYHRRGSCFMHMHEHLGSGALSEVLEIAI